MNNTIKITAAAAAAFLCSTAAHAAELTETGSVEWRSVATELAPSCTFGTPTHGEMMWDADTGMFNVTTPASIEVTFTNIDEILIARERELSGDDGNTISIDGTSTTTASAGTVRSGATYTFDDTRTGEGGFDTTARDEEDQLTVTLTGDVTPAGGATPVVGVVYTANFTVTCDDGT